MAALRTSNSIPRDANRGEITDENTNGNDWEKALPLPTVTEYPPKERRNRLRWMRAERRRDAVPRREETEKDDDDDDPSPADEPNVFKPR